MQLFNEINEDGDDSIEEDEFVQFVEGIRSSTQQEMLHFIALGLARSKTFWASFIFIISGLVGVFGTVVWWTPFSADTHGSGLHVLMHLIADPVAFCACQGVLRRE